MGKEKKGGQKKTGDDEFTPSEKKGVWNVKDFKSL